MRAAGIVLRVVLPCAACGLLLGGAARADQPTTWTFDVQTTGQDVFWTSPTAVNNTAQLYKMTYNITQLVVRVRYLIFDFDVDVTDQIPPEQRSQSGLYDGPPPLVVLDTDLPYPPPPDPPSLSAHLRISLDEAGYGHADATDVYLGEGDIEIPGIGYVHVQLRAIHLAGTLTALPLWFGDVNCDNVINPFDIDPFILALTDEAAYAAAYPNCDRATADCNHDTQVNPFDIDAFIYLLTGP